MKLFSKYRLNGYSIFLFDCNAIGLMFIFTCMYCDQFCAKCKVWNSLRPVFISMLCIDRSKAITKILCPVRIFRNVFIRQKKLAQTSSTVKGRSDSDACLKIKVIFNITMSYFKIAHLKEGPFHVFVNNRLILK
jgi:hypothetical protein